MLSNPRSGDSWHSRTLRDLGSVSLSLHQREVAVGESIGGWVLVETHFGVWC